jgi:hypothetical protein
MRTPRVWPYFTPSSVGALMDPVFLRRAVDAAGPRPWAERSMQPAVPSRWAIALARIVSAVAAGARRITRTAESSRTGSDGADVKALR